MGLVPMHPGTAAALALACACVLAPASQPTNKWDPELRAELLSDLEKRYPNWDRKTKREVLRKIEHTPKLNCGIEAVTVYADGIVTRATLRSDLPFDCRVSFLGRALSLVCAAHLTDDEGKEWHVPALKNHYHFVPLTEEWTVLIPRGKCVSITHVDWLEAPRPVPVKPAAGGKARRPGEFHYTILGYSSAYQADLSKRRTVYRVGRGKVPVQWKDGPIPAGAKTGVVPTKKRGDTARAALSKLQGTWYHVSRQERGKEVAGEAKDILWVVRGEVFISKQRDRVWSVGTIKVVDPDSDPKKMDLVITDGANEGKTILAVYQVDEETFRYCGCMDARPTSLATRRDDRSYTYCSTYRRLKR